MGTFRDYFVDKGKLSMFKTISLYSVVAARQRYVNECQDTKQWTNCITAYANKECDREVGCDRTCGKCNTNICYDMIPQPHDHFFQKGMAVKSEWPSLENSGSNILPSKKREMVNDVYPFDEGAVSDTCLRIFKDHNCEAQNLELTYTWLRADDSEATETITLNGLAFEYCRFSCGRCLQTDGCFSTHNNAMQFLARDHDADTASLNLGFGSFGQEGSFNWNDFNFGGDTIESFDEVEDTAPSEGVYQNQANSFFEESEAEEIEVQDNFSEVRGFEAFGGFDFGSFGWEWRKRRDLNGMDRGKVIQAALKSVINDLQKNYGPKATGQVIEHFRKRRQSQLLGEIAGNERQQHLESIQTCWVKNSADAAGVGEAVEQFEEEEESGSDIDQIIERRGNEDDRGIDIYINNFVDTEKVENTGCDYHPMPFLDTDGSMMLHYLCDLKCGSGDFLSAYNSMTEETEAIKEFLVGCDRQDIKARQPSSCKALRYPNWRVFCQEVDEPEVVEAVENNAAYDNAADENNTAEEESALDDYLASIYDMYKMY